MRGFRHTVLTSRCCCACCLHAGGGEGWVWAVGAINFEVEIDNCVDLTDALTGMGWKRPRGGQPRP